MAADWRLYMKVILTQDVKAQGKKGDLIEVSDGYGRNYLIARKLAIPADAKAINELKNREASQAYKIETEKAAAREIAAKLEGILVKFPASAGADGRLYGSITSKDIAEKLAAEHGITVDKRKITMTEPIKAYGSYEVDVRLYTDVTGKIRLIVTEK